jgi:ankyrin repeat protein
MHGKLGQWWLKRRMQFKGAAFDSEELNRGNLSEVQATINSGHDLNAFIGDTNNMAHDDQFTLLMYASGNNFLPAVVKLLSEDSIAVNFASKNRGWSALHLACQCGNLEVAHRLVNHGADVNQGDYFDGFSPLYIAALYGNVGCVRLLTSNGAILHSEVLVIASAMGHSKVVSVLMAQGANQNRKSKLWMGVPTQDVAHKLRQSSVLQVGRLQVL